MPLGDLVPLELGFDLAPGPVIRNGVIGTSMAVSDIAADVATRRGERWALTVESLLQGVSDIDPSPEAPLVCTRTSVSFTFEGVAVEPDR